MPNVVTDERERRVKVGMCLRRCTVEAIDKLRGMIPRSSYIDKLLSERLNEISKTDGQ